MTAPNETLAGTTRDLGRALGLVVPGLVLGAAAYGVFELPYVVGPFRRSVSVSYGVGFNNSVAVVSVVAAFGLLYLWHWFRSAPVQAEGAPVSIDRPAASQLGWRHYALAAGLYVGAAALTFALVPSDYFNEQGYFMRRLYLAVEGRRPFVDFEFGYGAAVIFVPTYVALALQPLGVSVKASYYLVHGAFNVLALGCLLFFVNHLRLSPRGRRIVFWFIAIAAYYPFMGMNSVLLRFLFAPTSLLLLAKWTAAPGMGRAPALAAAGAGGLALANFWISPEFGVAYWVTGVVYLGLAWDRRLLPALVAHLLTLPALLVAIPASLDILFSASSGGASLPIVPAPHILVYLFALLIVAPRALAAATRNRKHVDPLTTALIVFALGGVPAALGRCDPGHVVNYGLVLFMLVFVASARWPRWAFSVHAVLFFLVIVAGNQFANLFVVKWDVLSAVYPYVRAHADAGGMTALRWLGYSEADARARLSELQGTADGGLRYERLARYPALGLPLRVDEGLEHYLRSSGKYAPDYHVENLNVFGDAQLERKLRDLAGLEYVVVDRRHLVAGEPGARPTGAGRGDMADAAHLQRYLSILFKYPVRLTIEHDYLFHEAQIAAYVAQHYEKVDEVGGYDVMKRRRAGT